MDQQNHCSRSSPSSSDRKQTFSGKTELVNAVEINNRLALPVQKFTGDFVSRILSSKRKMSLDLTTVQKQKSQFDKKKTWMRP